MIIELEWHDAPVEPLKKVGDTIKRLIVLEHSAPTAKEMHILLDLGFELIVVPRTRMPHSPFIDERQVIDLVEEYGTYAMFTKDSFEVVRALKHDRITHMVVPKRNEEGVMVGALVYLP